MSFRAPRSAVQFVYAVFRNRHTPAAHRFPYAYRLQTRYCWLRTGIATKQLQPVTWTKSTFLSPQHLRVQDRFIEDTLNFRLPTLKFCPWGFRDLILNHALLADGQLAVSSAFGIFPDRLLFDIPEADQPPPSKALAELFDPYIEP